MARRRWSELAESTRQRYRAAGVSGRRYAAWEASTPQRRRRVESAGLSREQFLRARSASEFRELERRGRRANLESRALDNLRRLVGDRQYFNPQGIEARLSEPMVSEDDLIDVIGATLDQVVSRASEQGDRSPDYVNPFWYH